MWLLSDKTLLLLMRAGAVIIQWQFPQEIATLHEAAQGHK
jgi:hypothetical protein